MEDIKKMNLTKKFSFDLADENRKKLEKRKRQTRIPHGVTMNTMIDIFCGLPDELRTILNNATSNYVQTLSDQMDHAGEFELANLTSLTKKSLDLLTFLNDGCPVSLESIKAKPRLKTIQIKDGIVIFPEDWIILNQDAAPGSMYAVVVEIRDMDGIRLPHFIYFSISKLKNMSNYEISQINQLCANASKLFQEAQKRQVRLIEDPKNPGQYLNLEEYLASPEIGHFDLYEEGEHPLHQYDYEPPYGARIIRKQKKEEP